MNDSPTASPDFETLARQVGALDDPVDLLEQSYQALTLLLPQAENGELLDQLSIRLGEIIGDLPLDAPERDLRRHTRAAAQHCVAILAAARDRRLPTADDIPALPLNDTPPPSQPPPRLSVDVEDEDETAPPPRQSADALDEPVHDLEYYLPPHLAHLLRHIQYDEPSPPPPPGGFTSFDQLCLAALNHRIDRVLTFFHKNNPTVTRLLPPPFLLSPDFAGRFKQVVEHMIFPRIANSRQLRLLASNIDLSKDAESFWDHINDSMKRLLQLTWNTAWDHLRLIPEQRGDQTVMLIGEDVRTLRQMLQPPTPHAYDLPRITNREIELFRSLLSTSTDWWPPLSAFWHICHTTYEQEWDPRVFQQQAREGALRDTLLQGFENLPDPWHDFVVLMAHRVFPRISTRFLERFAYNFGQSEESREQRMPYLIRTIRQARDLPEIRRLEHQDEENWQRQVQALHDYFKGKGGGD